MLDKQTTKTEYFNYLYDTYAKSVYHIAYIYLKNKSDCEDIVQDVFYKIFKKNLRFDDVNYEKRYILKIAANMSINYLKKSFQKNIELTPKYDKAVFVDFSDKTEIFRKLEYDKMIIVYLHYYAGFDIKEIAKMLKQKPDNIKMKLFRARQELKDILEFEKED